MANNHSFDRIHGRGALRRLRSMLKDSRLTYHRIGSEFGLTRQRIAQLAAQLDVNAKRRQHERVLRSTRHGSTRGVLILLLSACYAGRN